MWFDVTAAGVVTEAIMQWHRNGGGGGGGAPGAGAPPYFWWSPLIYDTKNFFYQEVHSMFFARN